MANDDLVLPDQHVLHQKPDNALPIGDFQCFSRRPQPLHKAGQGLGEPEIRLSIPGTIDDGFQFAMQGLLLTTELGRPVAQFVDGDQLLLIGIDQAVDALADSDQPSPQVGLALLVGIGGTRRLQSAVDLGADQRRVLKQADHLAPDNVIEQVLAHGPAVAQRSPKMAPGIGSETAVIGYLPCGRLYRAARQRVTALAARDQSLDHAGRLGAARRMDLVYG